MSNSATSLSLFDGGEKNEDFINILNNINSLAETLSHSGIENVDAASTKHQRASTFSPQEQSDPSEGMDEQLLSAPVEPDELVVVPNSKTSWLQPAPCVDYARLTSVELRRVCSERGIAWRNASSNGKHLTKRQMIDRLTA